MRDLSYWAQRRGEFNDAISPRPDTTTERIAAGLSIIAMIVTAVVFACN